LKKQAKAIIKNIFFPMWILMKFGFIKQNLNFDI